MNKIVNKKPHIVISFINEVKIFLFLFVIVTMGMLIFTNLDLFSSRFTKQFGSVEEKKVEIDDSKIYQDQEIVTSISVQEEEGIFNGLISGKNLAPSTQDLLKSRLSDYDFNFNTLPPVSKLIIPSIALDVAIVESKFKDVVDFTNGNFDLELMSGVVKYPTTPNPGEKGNSLIFGHTSQERWKQNQYGTIFKDIPRLMTGDRIQVIWEGNIFEYEVIRKIVVYPNQVNQEYLKYQSDGGKFLTLMGCYPLGTDKKRMMIFAKMVE